MNELICRLMADLRWRLSAAGRPFRPAAKEQQSWGTLTIPAVVPVLLWPIVVALAYIALSSLQVPSLADIVLPMVILAAPFGLFWARSLATRSAALRAYRQLLEHNERFVLAEYSKYLKRQVQRAQQDPALGGPAEVQRLQDAQQRLNQLLRQGAGLDEMPLRSSIADDADLAEAIVQTYEEGRRDPLNELDARLPVELRQRVEELEREALRQPGTEQIQSKQ